MKKYLLLSAVAAIAVTAVSKDANSSIHSTNANAMIVNTIQFNETQSLDFGYITEPPAAATVTIGSDGSWTDDAVNGAVAAGGTRQQAILEITSDSTQTLDIEVPAASVSPSDPNLDLNTFTGNYNAGGEVSIDEGNGNSFAGSDTAVELHIGANLDITNGVTVNTPHTIAFDVDVNYQ